MQMGYQEVVHKLKELDKIVYVFGQTIHLAEMRPREEYINIPIGILTKEMESLKTKIQDFKDNLVVSYDNDTTYLDEILSSKEIIPEGKK